MVDVFQDHLRAQNKALDEISSITQSNNNIVGSNNAVIQSNNSVVQNNEKNAKFIRDGKTDADKIAGSLMTMIQGCHAKFEDAKRPVLPASTVQSVPLVGGVDVALRPVPENEANVQPIPAAVVARIVNEDQEDNKNKPPAKTPKKKRVSSTAQPSTPRRTPRCIIPKKVNYKI